MNKNDLRFQKTEIAIKQAYLSLKKHGSKNVKVTDLCEFAMINKTTFYAHYETIEFLHKRVCDEFVLSMLKKCEDVYKLPYDIRAFIYTLLDTFMENMATIEKLYGEDLYALVNDVERVLMENYMPENINEDFELTIRFCIGGAFRLLVFERDPERVQKTVELVEKVLSN